MNELPGATKTSHLARTQSSGGGISASPLGDAAFRSQPITAMVLGEDKLAKR